MSHGAYALAAAAGFSSEFQNHPNRGPTPAYLWYVPVWASVSHWVEVINITADSPYPSLSLYRGCTWGIDEPSSDAVDLSLVVPQCRLQYICSEV